MDYISYLQALARRDARIAKQRAAGATLQALGTEYGMTRQRVHQICRRQAERAVVARAEKLLETQR